MNLNQSQPLPPPAANGDMPKTTIRDASLNKVVFEVDNIAQIRCHKILNPFLTGLYIGLGFWVASLVAAFAVPLSMMMFAGLMAGAISSY